MAITQPSNLVVWRVVFILALFAPRDRYLLAEIKPQAQRAVRGGTADGGESLAELADIYLAFAAWPDDSQRAQERERGS